MPATDLTPRAARLLKALERDPLRVFTKEQLVKSARMRSTRDLDSAAVELRAHFRALGERRCCNVWGVGYRLDDAAAAEVQP